MHDGRKFCEINARHLARYPQVRSSVYVDINNSREPFNACKTTLKESEEQERLWFSPMTITSTRIKKSVEEMIGRARESMLMQMPKLLLQTIVIKPP
ncbi:hypothetical protein ACTXT7_008507 [Hymenolepis weldensis]